MQKKKQKAALTGLQRGAVQNFNPKSKSEFPEAIFFHIQLSQTQNFENFMCCVKGQVSTHH
jgi:hypothetical protein